VNESSRYSYQKKKKTDYTHLYSQSKYLFLNKKNNYFLKS